MAVPNMRILKQISVLIILALEASPSDSQLFDAPSCLCCFEAFNEYSGGRLVGERELGDLPYEVSWRGIAQAISTACTMVSKCGCRYFALEAWLGDEHKLYVDGTPKTINFWWMVAEVIHRIDQTGPEDAPELHEMMEIHEHDYEGHDFKADVTKYFEGFKLDELIAKIRAYREGNEHRARGTLWQGGVQEPPDDIRPYVQGLLPIIADMHVMESVLNWESPAPEKYGAARLALLLPVVSSGANQKDQPLDLRLSAYMVRRALEAKYEKREFHDDPSEMYFGIRQMLCEGLGTPEVLKNESRLQRVANAGMTETQASQRYEGAVSVVTSRSVIDALNGQAANPEDDCGGLVRCAELVQRPAIRIDRYRNQHERKGGKNNVMVGIQRYIARGGYLEDDGMNWCEGDWYEEDDPLDCQYQLSAAIVHRSDTDGFAVIWRNAAQQAYTNRDFTFLGPKEQSKKINAVEAERMMNGDGGDGYNAVLVVYETARNVGTSAYLNPSDFGIE